MSRVRGEFDVVIAGGGMVGAALACALAQETPLSVAVVEAAAGPPPRREGFSIRVSAITRATEALFRNLGAWPAMVAERVSPFRSMHVWDAGSSGVLHFEAREVGEPHLGHIVENDVIVRALHARLAELPGVHLLAGTRPAAMACGPRGVTLETDGGRRVRARLVVAADGSRSWMRRRAEIAVRGWDYDQAALVTVVRSERWHGETAWQRFLPGGPLAFLPLCDHFSAIVWSLPPADAERLAALDAAALGAELEAGFESRLGAVEVVAERAVFPLRFFDAVRYVQPRLALVGDAAHTVHPLAGQGVNLGLGDAAALAEVLAEAAGRGEDPGALHVLRRYERWRRAENLAMLRAVDGFQRIFGSPLAGVRALRGLGMHLIQAAPPARRFIVRQAMGHTLHPPALARFGP